MMTVDDVAYTAQCPTSGVSGVCDDEDDVGIHDRQCCLLRSAQQVALAFVFIFFKI